MSDPDSTCRFHIKFRSSSEIGSIENPQWFCPDPFPLIDIGPYYPFSLGQRKLNRKFLLKALVLSPNPLYARLNLLHCWKWYTINLIANSSITQTCADFLNSQNQTVKCHFWHVVSKCYIEFLLWKKWRTTLG